MMPIVFDRSQAYTVTTLDTRANLPKGLLRSSGHAIGLTLAGTCDYRHWDHDCL
jgi:hypothetical protein